MTVEQLVVPRVDEREWVRQQEELAFLFAKSLRMSRWQYVDALPQFTPQPAEYRGRFDNLVLVQPPQPEKGLSLREILDIAGFSYTPEVLKMEDWKGDKRGFRSPTVVYATWVDDGIGSLNVAPELVRNNLVEDERGGTSLDGVFLYVADRGVLRRQYLDLPGSDVGSDYVPCLYLRDAGPQLCCHWVDDADPDDGSVVAGRKFVTR